MRAKTTAKDRENPKMGRRLKEKRKEMKVTQKEMANHLGMTVQAYQNYEYGKEISSGRIIQICAILKCSPNWLLGQSDEGAHLADNSLMLHQLRNAFDALNDEGQQKVAEYARDLATMPKYTERKNASSSDSVREVAE